MNPMFIVMRKELKEMFRDKRIRTNALIMPLFVMLMMLSFFGFIMGVGEKENQVMHIIKTDNSIVAALKKEKIQVNDVPDVEAGKELIRKGKARLVLEFPPDFDALQKAGKPTPINAYFDPQQDTGRIALASLQELIDKANKAVKDKVLAQNGLTTKSIEPMSVEEKPVQVGTSNTSQFLVSLLPYLIVIYAFYGGFASGSDIVAGEKEKYTLETLLITPVARTQIALGKFLSLAVICFASSFSALLGVIIAGSSGLPMYQKVFPNGLGLNAVQIATMIGVLIPTVAFFASLLIAVSAFAKNTREAQSHLAIISLIVLIPAIFGQVIGLTDLASNWWIRLVPVLNTSVTLREALQGKTNFTGVGLTVGMMIVLASIGIYYAVSMFKREQVLTRV
jgi:sodium transport system permease protein